ncbi:hypothetical protein [Pedobacter sp. WC2423]|uniref:hypothetical protein n=1 Tax=Pedobacter sp. WC2423 TaxID=3234142 RepID=UPI003465CE10
MVLGFKKQFVEPIMAGTKIHTIREDSNNRWDDGILIHMATGTRTKHYNCFKKTLCTSIQNIFMSYDYMLHISIDGRELYIPEKEKLAVADGFENLLSFENYWFPELQQRRHMAFSGKIIHWTDFRY